MSTVEKRRGGGIRALDTALMAAAVVGGILVILVVVHAVIGVLKFAFDVVVLVVVVALVVRMVHAVTRRR